MGDKRDDESDVSHLGLDCVQTQPPPSPSSETTEPIEYVYDLSKVTDEPILYRRDRIQTEEIVPSSSSSSVLFTSNTTGIVRSVSSGDLCNDLNVLDGNVPTTSSSDDESSSGDVYDDDVSTITTTSDVIC